MFPQQELGVWHVPSPPLLWTPHLHPSTTLGGVPRWGWHLSSGFIWDAMDRSRLLSPAGTYIGWPHLLPPAGAEWIINARTDKSRMSDELKRERLWTVCEGKSVFVVNCVIVLWFWARAKALVFFCFVPYWPWLPSCVLRVFFPLYFIVICPVNSSRDDIS